MSNIKVNELPTSDIKVNELNGDNPAKVDEQESANIKGGKTTTKTSLYLVK